VEAERKRENDMERCVIVACSSHVEVLLRCTAVYSFIYSKSVLHLVFLVGKGNDGMERKALFPQIPVSSCTVTCLRSMRLCFGYWHWRGIVLSESPLSLYDTLFT